MKTYGHFINGGVVDPAGARRLDVFDPFTAEVIAQVAEAEAPEGAFPRIRRSPTPP